MNSVELAQNYVAKATNAKKRNKEFTLSLISYANIKNQKFCAYSGIKFNDSTNIMSLERINNDVGYVDGNVIPVLYTLNNVRGDLDLQSIKLRILYIEEKLNKILSSSNKQIQKRVFNKKLYTKYMNLYKMNKILSGKIANSQQIVEEKSEQIRVMKLNKNQILHLDAVVENSKNKIIKLKNQIKNNERCLNRFYNNAPLKISKIPKIDKTKVDLKETQKIKCLINNLKMVEIGLAKFENLSNSGIQKLKLGLPLETSRYKLMKRKMANNMLENII